MCAIEINTNFFLSSHSEWFMVEFQTLNTTLYCILYSVCYLMARCYTAQYTERPGARQKMSAINFNKLKYATAKRVYMKYMHEYHFL